MMNNFAQYLNLFFTDYLPKQRNLSSKTIQSYKSTFKLLLQYLVEKEDISLSNIDFCHITKEVVLNFLENLEEKENSINTRNQRLHAIKSFFQYIKIEDPSSLIHIQQILSIRVKKAPKLLMDYLTLEETERLLNSINTNKNKGRRDLVLLSLLYDTAMRVEEITNIKVMDLNLGMEPTITILGKGRKYRQIPIMMETTKILKQYIEENRLKNTSFLFSNPKSDRLTTRTVELIVRKYVALSNCIKNITPHSIRRSRAIHMLEAGVSIVYIKDFLGHESIKTTEIYLQVSNEVKRQAITKAYSNTFNVPKVSSWNKDEKLLKELLQL